MTGVARVAIVVAVLLGALVWMFRGPGASNVVIGNANVVGGIAGLLALVAVMVPWLRAAHRRTSAAPATSLQAQTAADHLAEETLRYWQDQAKDRRITTPSPATVRWCWASDEVAVPTRDLHLHTEVLTAGVVTQLREQLYDRLGADQARIVLLGEAGAGKTAAMLLLLIDILKHRPKGSQEPVPVWLTLGGWSPDATSLRDWAAATLNRDYPGLAAPEHGGLGTAAQLIRTGRVALFLDGLDEMPPAVQGAALQAIDRDATGLRIVLTSRPGQYRTALTQGRLYGAAVIDLLPVEVEQAEEFLLAEQLGERRRAWQEVIAYTRTNPDSPIARTLTTPLALSLAYDTYTSANPIDLLDTNQYPHPDALLQHLLTRSLTLAYPDPAERAHATYWLSWIARHMGTNRDLRWWKIPTWTAHANRKIVFQRMSGLMFGLVFGLIGLLVGLASELTFRLIFALILALIGGLVGLLIGLTFGLMINWLEGALEKMLAGRLKKMLAGGLMGKLRARSGTFISEPHHITVRWPSRQEWREQLPFSLLTSLAVWSTIGLMLGLLDGLAIKLKDGLVIGLAFGLAFGLADWLAQVWSTPLAAARTGSPVGVYLADRRRALTVGLASGLVIGLASTLAIGLAFGLVIGLTFGPALGLMSGLVTAAGPTLRLEMAEASWGLRLKRVRFMQLLQTALRKQVLRQAGAVYQFRHAALQDLLATSDISTHKLNANERHALVSAKAELPDFRP